MDWVALAKKAEKLVVDNSPTILTGLGVTGTLITAYLTGRASYTAAEIIVYEEKHRQLTNKEKLELVWKLYIPPVVTGVLTVACVIGANRIGTRRAAAVAAAYSISERAFAEYKDKVVERIGVGKEQTIRAEVAEDHIRRHPISEHEVIITGNGDVLCYDTFTDRYFNSSMESLKKAQNDINYEIINNSYACLSDFYNLIGLSSTAYSNEIGWNLDNLIDLKFSTILSEDGRPCISLEFRVAPVRDYHKFH